MNLRILRIYKFLNFRVSEFTNLRISKSSNFTNLQVSKFLNLRISEFTSFWFCVSPNFQIYESLMSESPNFQIYESPNFRIYVFFRIFEFPDLRKKQKANLRNFSAVPLCTSRHDEVSVSLYCLNTMCGIAPPSGGRVSKIKTNN